MRIFKGIWLAALVSLLICAPAWATNSYYNSDDPLDSGSLGDPDVVNDEFDGIEDAFDKFPDVTGSPPGFSEVYIILDGDDSDRMITIGQFQDGGENYGAVSGSNTLTMNLDPAVTAYATGQHVFFLATSNNTGATTLNLNGVGAEAIKRDSGADLLSADIASGGVYEVMFDGTNWVMLGVAPSYDQGLNTTSSVEFADVTTDDFVEASSGAGVTLDGVLLKDGSIGTGYGGTGEATATAASAVIFLERPTMGAVDGGSGYQFGGYISFESDSGVDNMSSYWNSGNERWEGLPVGYYWISGTIGLQMGSTGAEGGSSSSGYLMGGSWSVFGSRGCLKNNTATHEFNEVIYVDDYLLIGVHPGCAWTEGVGVNTRMTSSYLHLIYLGQ